MGQGEVWLISHVERAVVPVRPDAGLQDFPPGTWWRAIVYIRDGVMRSRALIYIEAYLAYLFRLYDTSQGIAVAPTTLTNPLARL